MAVFNQMAGRPKRATGATQSKARPKPAQQVVKPQQKQLQRALPAQPGQQDELRQRLAQDLQQMQQVQRQFAQQQGGQAQPAQAQPAQIEAGRAAAARFQQQNQLPAPAQQAPRQAMTGREQLGQQITGFLGSQLAQATRPGQQDQITQSQLTDFDEQTRRAREQQIEDLNRFGIIGGGGVSSGRVADILGRFDADTLRGRQAVKAAGLNRMLGTILPQAVQQARFRAPKRSNGKN